MMLKNLLNCPTKYFSNENFKPIALKKYSRFHTNQGLDYNRGNK